MKGAMIHHLTIYVCILLWCKTDILLCSPQIFQGHFYGKILTPFPMKISLIFSPKFHKNSKSETPKIFNHYSFISSHCKYTDTLDIWRGRGHLYLTGIHVKLEKISLFAPCQRARFCVKPFHDINFVHQHSHSGWNFENNEINPLCKLQ